MRIHLRLFWDIWDGKNGHELTLSEYTDIVYALYLTSPVFINLEECIHGNAHIYCYQHWNKLTYVDMHMDIQCKTMYIHIYCSWDITWPYPSVFGNSYQLLREVK